MKKFHESEATSFNPKTPTTGNTQTIVSEIELHPLGMTRAKPLVDNILPFGLTTLWAWSKDGRFPAPVKVGNNITAWRNQDVIDWLNSQTPAPSLTDEVEVL